VDFDFRRDKTRRISTTSPLLCSILRASRNIPHRYWDNRDRHALISGTVPFSACTKVKSWFHYDDALDTFGIHAVGGTTGAFLTGLLATSTANLNLRGAAAVRNGLAAKLGHSLWLQQLGAIAVTIVLAVLASAAIGALVNAAIGLRIAPEIERQGLDINEHGEEGYITS